VKIEATAKDIRTLLELAELDRGADQAGSKARRQGREAVARRVPRPLLARYELLLEVGRNPVVVAIERGACSGCHVRLPTMVEYKARRAAAVHTCPHCRRMLYAPNLVREEPDASDVKKRVAAPASTPGRS
jgi:predicted  nucleic acid-binding Zn-ribbon protein